MKVSTGGGSYRLVIHDNLEFAGTILVADPVYVCVSHFKGV
jgi:hypothetical protein